jgi:hypothetical protein
LCLPGKRVPPLNPSPCVSWLAGMRIRRPGGRAQLRPGTRLVALRRHLSAGLPVRIRVLRVSAPVHASVTPRWGILTPHGAGRGAQIRATRRNAFAWLAWTSPAPHK